MIRTPAAIEGGGGANSAAMKKAKGRMLMVRDQMADLAFANGLKVSDAIAASGIEYGVAEELLPTPTAREIDPKATAEEWFAKAEDYAARGKEMPTVPLGTAVAVMDNKAGLAARMRMALFDTPDTMPDMPNSGSNRKTQVAGLGNQAKAVTSGEILLPTPKALDGFKGNLSTSAERQAKGFFVDLPNVAVDLMPTPQARDGKDGTEPRIRDGEIQTDSVAKTVLHSGEVFGTNWGKFEPAIRRWEKVLGRPAPAPTKPDGKDGAHRLSSKFTEWLMGLPDGWITDAGLSRNEELKAAGNGVVPQQAELALRILLEGIEI